MSTNTIDPMEMDDPFSDPATGGGLDEFKGLVVIVRPLAVSRKASQFPTSDGSGMVDTVQMEVTAVTGDEPGKTVTTSTYSGSLVPQLKTRVGKMVIGKLDKIKMPKGMGWNLAPATAEDRAAGKKVLADIKARAEAKAKSEDPFD
jgi:hypothetical protein